VNVVDDRHHEDEPDDVAEDDQAPTPGNDTPDPTAAAGPPAQQARQDTDALLEDRLRRALADLDNLRKRYDREVERERAAERRRVAAQWLPVVDDLERALEHVDTSAATDPDAFVEGVRAIRDRAIAVLAQLGFPRYEDTGAQFDPVRHEAVGVIDSDAPPGTVVAAVRPGYGTADDILRPAGVVVSRSDRRADEDVVARDPR
jgi:molecular chaperone GrpE